MEFTNLKLIERESIIDGITLYEPLDISILDKLINSTLLKTTFNNKYAAKKYTSEKKQLQKYRETIINGRAVINYNRVQNINFGRCNPRYSVGLFSIRREIRHTLAKNYFEDIDIDNCHPVILEQICIKNTIECDVLHDYIINRQEWFNLVNETWDIKKIVNNDKVLMKDIPKNLFIRIMYHGGVKDWVGKYKLDGEIPVPKKILKFINQIDKIMQVIYDNNPLLVERVKNKKINNGLSLYNLKGSVCSYYLQDKECAILEEIYIYCKNKGLILNDNCVLCADGLMIQKKLFKNGLLLDLNNLIKNKFDINVNFSNKLMDQDYLKILNNSLNFELHKEAFSTGLIADYFRIMYSNKFINVDNKLYSYNGIYWKAEICKKNSTLHNFIDTTFYKHLIDYIAKIISLQNAKISSVDDKTLIDQYQLELKTQVAFLNSVNNSIRAVTYRKHLVDDIMNKITNNYIKFDENPYLFCFENKIYDLSTSNFLDPSYDQYLSMTTGYNYDVNYQKDYIIELNNIIDTIFPNADVKKYYLTALSTGLYGEHIEKLFVANGTGGNGKGLINSLMMDCVGTYGYRLPSTILLQPIKEGANPAVANMHKKRFCLSQEPDGRSRICAATMKEITGDSNLNCRTLYSSDTNTKLNLSFFLECNDLPKMDEVNDGILRRTEVIPFISRFVDDATFNSLSETERTERNIFKGNTYYKTDEFKFKYKQGLVMLLMDAFQDFKNNNYTLPPTPTLMKEAVNDYLSVSDDIYSWFSTVYEPSEDDNFIYFDEIFKRFESSSFYLNLSKKDRREMNLKALTKKITENVFLQKYVKKALTRYGGIKHTKPYITGFKGFFNNINNFYGGQASAVDAGIFTD